LVEQELILFLDGVFEGILVVAGLDIGGFEDETVEVLFGVEGNVGCYVSVVDSEEEESLFCLEGNLRGEEDGVLVLLRGSRSLGLFCLASVESGQ
jgi:hypothetical protein